MPGTADSTLWRIVRTEFEALANHELEAAKNRGKRLWLVASVSFPKGLSQQCVWWIYGHGNEQVRASFDVLAKRAGVALGSPRRTDPEEYWLRCLYVSLLKQKSEYLRFTSQEVAGGIIDQVIAASVLFCNRLEESAVRAEHLRSLKPAKANKRNKPTAARPTTPELSNPERMGRRRAQLVAKLIMELNALRLLMEVPEDDYPKLSKQHPHYQVFKICKKHPGAVSLVKLLPYRRFVHTIAYQLAATVFGVSSATIATAWKRYKPRAIKPQ